MGLESLALSFCSVPSDVELASVGLVDRMVHLVVGAATREWPALATPKDADVTETCHRCVWHSSPGGSYNFAFRLRCHLMSVESRKMTRMQSELTHYREN